jgi:hypothetical protein
MESAARRGRNMSLTVMGRALLIFAVAALVIDTDG